MNRLKILFIIATVSAMITSVVLISLGVYEVMLDQKKIGSQGLQITHLFIALSMFCACNILIFLHVIYITQYMLRNRRYHWHISAHYLLYVVWEIISVCCIFSKFDDLQYPYLLICVTGGFFVFLFFFNCWAVQLFEQLEDKIESAEERKFYRHLRTKRRKGACVRVSLRGSDVNAGASTSGSPRKERGKDKEKLAKNDLPSISSSTSKK